MKKQKTFLVFLNSIPCQVSVLDVNDCKPVFRSPVMEVYVREDAQIGDLVTTLTSVDQDEDKNADVTYAFISGKGLHEIFVNLQKVIVII